MIGYAPTSVFALSTDPSVDHYVAKSGRWDLAYEWSNYRLACAAMNS